MAAKGGKKFKKTDFVYVRKLLAGVSLLMFLVVLVSGSMAGASFASITFRAFLVMMVLKISGVIVIRMLSTTYEETNRG